MKLTPPALEQAVSLIRGSVNEIFYTGPFVHRYRKKTRGISQYIWVRDGSMEEGFPQKFSGDLFKNVFRKVLEFDI